MKEKIECPIEIAGREMADSSCEPAGYTLVGLSCAIASLA